MRYESVRRRALQRLKSLPPEGLRAYRLLYDGRAKRLFEHGRAAHDPRRLRVVVDRYLLTRYGDDAADLLASWALDEGRPGEAIRLLADLVDLVPDYDVPRLLIASKLAAAYSLLGREEEAKAVLDAYRAATDAQAQHDEYGVLDSVLTLRPLGLDRGGDPVSWPVVGGTPTREGLMPAVEPTLLEAVPWRSDLPGAVKDAWRRVLHNDATRRPILPVGQLVADNRRLFARTRWGCIALDMEDLKLLWDSGRADTGAPASRSAGQRRSSRQSTGSLNDKGYAFGDYVVGGISLGHGLAMIISREGKGQYTLAERDAGGLDVKRWLPRPLFVTRFVQGARLVAYDVETGRVRWQRGRTGHSDDPLGDVSFQSVPIAVGEALWVPFLRQGDLNVAVLDPEDGALLRTVLLCSLGRSAVPARYALQPALADGMLYVPSGQGLLFAVDTGDYTIRWATQLGPVSDKQRALSSDERGGWLSSPPVVSGGLVLVAPRERDELTAFAAATGEFKWSAGRGDALYIIAADQRRVWLGGRSVYCLSLSNGEMIWSADIEAAPTGRGVLSDELVYVPTADGLLSVRAATGKVLGYAPAPASHGPLGNLLCLDDAMFSINPSCVWKYPDIERTYPLTLKEHEADPSDLVFSVRLAWLEMLRGQPQRAYDVLEAIPPAALEGDAERAKDAAHVRVEALLKMTVESGASRYADAELLTLLEQANRTAPNAMDRLRCTLAIGDLLSTMGRSVEAYRRLWQLGISSDSDQVVPSGDHVGEMARFSVARRLREVAHDLTDEQQSQLGEYTLAQTAAIAKQLGSGARCFRERAQLRAIADLQAPGSTGQQALIELASYHAGGARYEQAEQLFRESIRLASQPALTVASLVRLCRLYAEGASAGLGFGSALMSGLEELESRFGTEKMPEAASEMEGLSEQVCFNGLVANWVRQVQSDFSPTELGDYRSGATDVPVQLTGELAWSLEPRESPGVLRRGTARADVKRVIGFGEQPPVVLTDRIVVYGPDDVLSCHRADDGEVLWKAALRLPETFTDEAGITWLEGEDVPRRAVAEGQTAVFNGREGLFAVGLATGRRIWVRPYENERDPRDPLSHDTTMTAGGGLLAAMPKAGQLTLMRMLDGSTVWERDLLGERVEYIWMLGDRVVTVDAPFQRVHLFDRTDGRLVKRVLFEQPDPENLLVSLVNTADTLCGPTMIDNSEGVVGVDLASGEIVWRLQLEKPLVQLFRPQDGYLGLSLLGGDVRIVDGATGELVVERRVSGAHGVIRGTLVNGTLLVQYYTLHTGIRSFEVAALDVATDTELWRRGDLLPLWRIGRPLRVNGGRMPALIQTDELGTDNGRTVHLAMIDVRSGLSVGAELRLQSVDELGQFNGDFELYAIPGIAVVGTDTGIHALRMGSATEHTEGVSE